MVMGKGPKSATLSGLAGWLAAVAVFSARHALAVLAIWGLAAALSLAAAVLWLKVDTNPARMINPELDFRQDYQRLTGAFPQLDNSFVALVESTDAQEMRAAALAVEQSFRARPDLFSHVFAPELSAMFRDYGALWLPEEKVRALTGRIAAAAPMLKALAARPGLDGLAGLVAGMKPAIAARRAPPMLTDFFSRMGDTVIGALKDRPVVFDWRKLGGNAPMEPPARYAIIVKPKLDFSALDPAARAMAEARRIVHDPEITGRGRTRVWLTGEAAMNAEEFETVTSGAVLAGLASLLIVSVVIVLGLPAKRMVLPALALVVLGFAVNAGFATLAIGSLNMISVAFAVLFIGLGVDYAVHYLLRWAEEARRGHAPAHSTGVAAAGVGPALALSALTTILGFLAFSPTDFAGMAQLGIIAAGGIAIALIGALTLIPALIRLLPCPERWKVRPGEEHLLRRNRVWPHWRRILTIGVLAAAAASLIVLPKVRFDGDPVNLKDPSSPAVIAFNRLLEDDPGLVYALSALAADEARAERLKKRLAALPQVGKVRTVKDFLPAGQGRKLALLHGLKGQIPQRVRMGRNLGETARLRALSALSRSLRDIARMQGAGATLRKAALRLHRAIDLFLAEKGGQKGAAAQLERAMFIRLPELVSQLRKLANAPRITIASMDAGLRRWYVAQDGRWRVEISPRGALDSEAAMADFAAAVRAAAPHATGAPVEITGAARVVSRAMLMATGLALTAVLLTVLVVMRSLRATVLVLAPIVLAAVLLCAYTVVFNAPFNFANVIVIPLLLGLGVDSAIHYVHRARMEAAGAQLEHTSTPRAVVISALTTIGSFGTLWLTPHRGMSSMGELLTVSVGLTLLTTLVVLPELIGWTTRRKNAGGGLDQSGPGRP